MSSGSRRGILGRAILAWCATGSSARAQYPDDGKGQISFELGLHVGDVYPATTTTSLSPLISGYWQISEPVRLVGAWGFNLHFWHFEAGPLDNSETRFYAGNPYIAGLYTSSSEKVSYSVGAGLALPVANADDRPVFPLGPELSAGVTAAAMRGWWDLYLWWPDTFSVVVPGQAQYWITDRLLLLGDLTPMIFVPLDPNGLFETPADDDDAEVGIQFAAELGYKVNKLMIGGRLQNVWLFTAEDDNYQVSLLPFAVYDFGKWFLHGELQINLTEAPFTDGRYWGLMATAGLTFGRGTVESAPTTPTTTP